MIIQTQVLDLFLLALILHAILAGVDVLLNHEFLVQLPRQVNAVTEQCLHSARELIFTLIFLAIAWVQWHGHAVWIILVLLLIELLITTIDTVVEVETRKLPISERINHVLLYMNFGAICLLFALLSKDWFVLTTALRFSYYGLSSWLLSLAACGALFFCIRDAVAAIRLGRQKRAYWH